MTGAPELERVLVLTVRKSFWAATEAERFPRRLYAPTLCGPSHSLVNSGTLALRALWYVWRRPPGLILIGAAHRIAPWFARLRRLRLLRGARLVITNQKGLPDALVPQVDRIIEYSHRAIALRPAATRERCIFVPLPADGDFDAVAPASGGADVFSGGGDRRDYLSLIEAIRGLDVSLRIVTFSPEYLGYDGELPPNCDVRWRMPLQEFLGEMAAATIVALALQPGRKPRGQTTTVQALRLGKAVVTTRDAGLDDYVVDGREGLLVDAGDVAGYRRAIERLLRNEELRRACERHARERAEDLTYKAFADRLEELCTGLLEGA